MSNNKEEKLHLGSAAEDLFIEVFCETFGPDKANNLGIQIPFVDIYGNHRFIDFALESVGEKIAIEIDGETWHNPGKVSSEKYYDDLLKQNSLIYQNWKVYRWVYNQLLTQRDRVKDELINFLGDYPLFKEIHDFLPEQKGQAIILKDHQKEAIDKLEEMRSNNETMALLYHATGTGKTITAVTDAKRVGKRTLFIAHTKELIQQAKEAFEKAWSEVSCGIYMGSEKVKDTPIVCASIQSLIGNLNEFEPEDFGYIIIDEFHHAAAGNYKSIINYFKPKFLLGLTATPERLDNKDVFAICDYNTVYEVRLKSAINKGWLVPFRYYGIYDDAVDYGEISFKNGKYDENQLEKALMINKRAELILRHYQKYTTERALGFCSTRKHAEYMAEYFCKNAVKACAVVSSSTSSYSMDRTEAVNKLTKGEIQVIFSVDMFNEGLDIPSVDLVMFLRPTESPTVFLQQLGRGLRKAKDKNYLNVLDFIGNYKKANLVPFFLTGQPKTTGVKGVLPKEEMYPEDCFIDFDFRIIDIFKKMEEQSKRIQDFIREEYLRIKEQLGYRPSRTEMFTYVDEDIYENMRKQSKNNIFRNYFGFLKEIGELTSEEQAFMGTLGEEFINMVENTSMNKTYKMPILLAFYNEGALKMRIGEEDIYNSFKNFYSLGSNSIDLLNQKSTEGFKTWEKKDWVKLAKDNPVKFLAKTHGDFFTIEGEAFCLNEELEEFKGNVAFMRNFRDAVALRTLEYYKNRYENKQKLMERV